MNKLHTISSLPAKRQKGQDWLIEELPGLNKEMRSHFESLRIYTTQQLLHQANTLQQKQELSQQLQLSLQALNKWVAMADLSRLPSVGCQYCGLLLHAGIASVSQLANTPISRLHTQILRLQVATMQRRDLCPSVEKVQQWVAEAKSFR